MQSGDLPLAGYSIGVSAAHSADQQIALWENAGAEVEHAPMTEIVPLGAEVVDTQVRRLIEERTEVIVFTSRAGVLGVLRSAVRMGLSNELAHVLDEGHVVAANPEAATQLTLSGFSVDATSRGREPPRVASLIDHPTLHGRTVAIQLDGHASDEWEDALRVVGIRPRLLSMYLWGPPRDLPRAEELVRHALGGRLDAVSFISRGAVEQFGRIAEVIDPRADLSPHAAVCIDAGCELAARRLGFGEVLTPERAGLGAMVRTTADEFRRRAQVIELGGHRLVLQGRLVELDGDVLALSDREFDVLAKLVERPGSIVSKADLARSVWGGTDSAHNAEVAVARLRRRLAESGIEIETIIRRGYRLSVDGRIV